MEPTIYKPSIYKGEGIYKTVAGGGGGINLKEVAVLTEADNGINFETKEIVARISKAGFHIYNGDYSIYPAPQHKQGFECICKISNYSNNDDYGIFGAGAPVNCKGISFQIEHGIAWIGIPGDNNSWIDGAFIDVSNILEANKFFKLYVMYDLDSGLLEFSIDDVILLSTIVFSNKNNFGTSDYFSLFCTSIDTRLIKGSIQFESIKIINDHNIFK